LSHQLLTWPVTPTWFKMRCEYGLIAALIAVGIIAAATTLGNGLSTLFNNIAGRLDDDLPT
jgi:Flp pilus assembly pilin Flp